MIMKFPGWLEKAVTLSYDDGVVQDARLIEILNTYGLKATFNLNSGPMFEAEHKANGRLNQHQAKDVYGVTGHEVALHTWWHPSLVELSTEEIKRQVLEDQQNLERLFERKVCGMAYPFGTYNDNVIGLLKELGVAYARTANSTGNFALPQDWLQWTATCHHGDTRLWELVDLFLTDKDGDRDASLPQLFYLWGHSYEFDNDKNWDRIETFCCKLGGRSDIWYATNMEIYEYTEAFRKLRIDTKNGYMDNPSGFSLWLQHDGRSIVVDADSHIAL